jgi:hypothetical protein
MYRVKIFALGFLYLLSACSTFGDSNSRIFILGKWIGESSPDTNVQYVLKFLPFNILLADIKTPDEEAHNILFTYRFIDRNQITIKGRFLDELQITKRDNNLVTILSVYGFIPDGNYERDPFTCIYFLSTLLLGIFLFMIGGYLKRRKSKLEHEVSKLE